jgi:hypothetical protein
MPESEYIRRQAGNHPEPEYIADLKILRRFVENGSFGYSETHDVVFLTLKARYPEAYAAFGRERKQEVLERYKISPYIEEQTKAYPNNPDKDSYLKFLERLRLVMILFRLGYGSREMAMLRVNSKRRFPEAYSAFEGELEDI